MPNDRRRDLLVVTHEAIERGLRKDLENMTAARNDAENEVERLRELVDQQTEGVNLYLRQRNWLAEALEGLADAADAVTVQLDSFDTDANVLRTRSIDARSVLSPERGPELDERGFVGHWNDPERGEVAPGRYVEPLDEEWGPERGE